MNENMNNIMWHVSQLSEWFGVMESQSVNDPFHTWAHDAVQPDENGVLPPAVILDGNTVTVHVQVPRTLYFAVMGYAASADLIFEEIF